MILKDQVDAQQQWGDGVVKLDHSKQIVQYVKILPVVF